MPDTQEVLSWRGHQLCDRDGDKVGKIEEIYLDAETDRPEWALVNTGLFGSKSTFVPLREASADGDDVRVPYAKDQIKDAPRIDTGSELSQREEAELYRHYGQEYSELRSESGLPEGGRETTTTTTGTGAGADADAGAGETGRTTAGGGTRDRRDSDTDDAMTRSEEELHVGTVQRETGRARLRKYVVTEDVEKTVPVQREEVRVETEPITDDNIDQAMRGPDISEAEHEVVLREEEPVVEKEAVPKERIRLDTETVTEDRQVSETVRKEKVDVDGPEDRDR